jgi:hypothetical protein
VHWREATIHELQTLCHDRESHVVHGSECRDLLLKNGCPGALVDSYTAEKVLEEALVPLIEQGPRMTTSQRAFIGLQYRKHPGFVAGAKEHYYWMVRRPNDVPAIGC